MNKKTVLKKTFYFCKIPFAIIKRYITLSRYDQRIRYKA